MSLNIFVSPEDKFEIEVGGVKFVGRPITAKEFLGKATMFSNFGKKMGEGKVLEEKEMDDLLTFLADQITSIAGVSKPIDKELLGTLKPQFIIELIQKVSEQMRVSNAEKSFH